jgi:hypothetical protein
MTTSTDSAKTILTFAAGAQIVIDRASPGRSQNNRRYDLQKLLPMLGGRSADDILAAEAVRVVDQLSVRGRPLSPATRFKYAELIRMAVRAAGVIDPVPGFKIEKPASAPRWFTNDEVSRILSKARPEERGFIALGSHAGLQIDELLRIHSEHVRVKDKVIYVPLEVNGERVWHELHGDYRTPDGYVVHGVHPNVWRFLKLFPFQPLCRSWHTLQMELKAEVGRWLPDALRQTARINYLALLGPEVAVRLRLAYPHLTLNVVASGTRDAAVDYFGLLHPARF